MIPALCAAISGIVDPKNAVWSMLMDVMTEASGFSTTFVTSFVPPIPVSNTSTLTPAFRNMQSPM